MPLIDRAWKANVNVKKDFDFSDHDLIEVEF